MNAKYASPRYSSTASRDPLPHPDTARLHRLAFNLQEFSISHTSYK